MFHPLKLPLFYFINRGTMPFDVIVTVGNLLLLAIFDVYQEKAKGKNNPQGGNNAQS